MRKQREIGGEEGFSPKRFLLATIITAVIIFAVWFFIGRLPECGDQACFNSNIESCSRTYFIEGNELIYEYKILGRSGDYCNINVKLLQGELNDENSRRLEGKDMLCETPFGIVMKPEGDISNCHGELKEGLQDLIIQKLHTYLVQNVGRINLEVLDIPGS